MMVVHGEYQNNNGRSKGFPWIQLQPEYEKIHNHKFISKQALKSKFDIMRKQYTLWKKLKHGETGLGWDANTGALNCSAAWWNMKIKQNPDVSGFRTKPPSKELQEAWEQLFGESIACGSKVVAPGMVNETSSEVPNVNLKNVAIDIDDNTDPYEVYNQYSDHLDAQENDFYPSLMRDVGEDVPMSCQIGISGQPNKSTNVTMKPKTVEMKRKGRESAGSKLFKEFIAKQEEKQDRVIKILESDVSSVTKDDPYSVARCMVVINGMVDGALMTNDSPLLYLAIDLIEDAVKREVFMNMRDDNARLKWLQHKQDRGN
ncbi:myb/SANT-like domain-containing protein [Artemisia annua]|uniref:Myb/SANT-like domain-containing protein n=1 Tax=Artemisia annua TaxID=35608 RepID=A0A2U1LEJ9_ARTAN|nr:myb/SANT-like domain-containing protein [Artemisia annua]